MVGSPKYKPDFFPSFLETCLAADEQSRGELAEQFAREALKYGAPILESPDTVLMLYKGGGERVAVIGDMNEWDQSTPLQRIGGTDLFYLRLTVDSSARMEYFYIVDDNDIPVRDPFNPHTVLNGFGGNSELAMPGYAANPLFVPVLKGQPGSFDRVEEFRMAPGRLSYEHTIHVFRPPDYDAGSAYPVIYFHDGSDYIEYGHNPMVLDALIKGGRIQPVIGVYITPPNRGFDGPPNRMTEYGMNPDYMTFVADEVVPFVDANFATRREPAGRMIAGVSFGGLMAVYGGFTRPDVFGLVHGQSGYFSFRDDQMIKDIQAGPLQPVRMFLDCGRYERCVGRAILPGTELDFYLANRRLNEVLVTKGYDHVYREYPEGHTWGNWRNHIIDSLIHFFGRGEPQ